MAPTIKTVHDEMRDAFDRIKTMVATAEAEDRDLNPTEQQEKDELVGRMTALDQKRQRGESFATLLRDVGGLQPPAPAAAAPNGHVNGSGRVVEPTPGQIKSLGTQFVETDTYKSLRAMAKTGRWQTPVVELQAAVTITPAHPLIPGGLPIVAPLQYPTEWGVAGLYPPGTIDGGMVQYLQETTWTNAAAVVALGAQKPESTKAFTLIQQGLVKIAHWIPVPDEMLEDVAGLQSLIDAQMRNGVVEEVNDQLVNGPGTAGTIMGLIALPGKSPTVVVPATPGVGVVAAAIAAQRAQIFTLSRVRPTAIVMNPLTWAGIATTMTTAGGYLAGPDTFGQGVAPMVWGLRVIETPEVPDGTAILGGWSQGAQLYTKGGVSVQATNSHDDYFTKNITAIRAEVRIAPVYYRPLAFGMVTGIPTADVTP